MNHLAAAYQLALRRHGLKQAAFAARNGLTPPELTRVTQGQFPSGKILHAFAHGWPDAETGKELIEAHLRDECERAGIKGAAPRLDLLGPSRSLEEDLHVLDKIMSGAPNLAVALKKLVQRLRESETKQLMEAPKSLPKRIIQPRAKPGVSSSGDVALKPKQR